jgi:NAD(P)-dependent dehydrogenase (short-subunit alcohol dehydrogenase family)
MRHMLFAMALVGSVLGATPVFAQTILITGSNRGLGFEFVKQYAERGWTVIATARRPERAAALNELASHHSNITIEKLDVLDLAQIDALAVKYEGEPIDVLVNNAGVLGDMETQTLGAFDYGNFQQVMGVNVYGVLAVSEAFRANVAMSDQKKIIGITSGAGVISRGGGGGPLHFYRASKVALNMALKGLASDLRDRGVLVGIIAPGTADTDMRRAIVGARAALDQNPADSVAGMMKVIANLTPANSAKPYNYDGRAMPW